jgi:hypothetical protein
VQLRVAVAAGVLREDGHRDAGGVLEPARLHAVDPAAVMPGANEACLALHVGDVKAHGFLDLGPGAGGAGLPLRRSHGVAGLLGLQSGSQRAGVGQ